MKLALKLSQPVSLSSRIASQTSLFEAIALTAIFMLAFTMRFSFNFILPHVNNYSACDAAEYLRNAALLTKLSILPLQFWQDCLTCLLGLSSPVTQANIRIAFSPMQGLAISGPIFPLYLVGCFVLTGSPFNLTNWAALLFVQSVISSLSCIFIALAGIYCFNKQVGYLAGGIAAVYPGFIVGSGRLYTETFACFMLTLLLWLTFKVLARNNNNYLAIFLAGSAVSCLQLTRSIMSLLSLLLACLTFTQHKRKLLAFLSFGAGLALIVVPWLAWQKLAFGSASLVVDRVGHYNLFVGTNTATKGWLSIPYPDGKGIEKKSFLVLIKESIEKSPRQWLKLMLDKPARLFKFPWNDFATPIGPCCKAQQVFFHQIILLLAALGLTLNLTTNIGELPPENDKLLARCLLLIVFLLHALYLLFITVPRYNLTAMPAAIIFAAAGIVALIKLAQMKHGIGIALNILCAAILLLIVEYINWLPLFMYLATIKHVILYVVIECLGKGLVLVFLFVSLWQALLLGRGNRTVAKSLLVLTTLIFVPLLCLPLRASGRWWEWQCPLAKPGQTIRQSFTVDPQLGARLQNRSLYLLIDAARAGEISSGVEIRINNRILTGPRIPGLALLENYGSLQLIDKDTFQEETEYIFACLTAASGISNSDLRQWLIIPLPSDLFAQTASCHDKQTLTVELLKTNSEKTTIFGSYEVSPNHTLIPSLTSCSWEKAFYGVENNDGLSDSRYDLKISSGAVKTTNQDLSMLPGKQGGKYNICLLAGPALAQEEPLHNLDPQVAAAAPFAISYLNRGQEITEVLDVKNLFRKSTKGLWISRLTGKYRLRLGKPGIKVSFRARFNSAQLTNFTKKKNSKATYLSPWTPYTLAAAGDWQDFDISLPLNTIKLAGLGNLEQLEYSFRAIDQPHQLYIERTKLKDLAAFKDVYLQVFCLSNNPLAVGHEIF